MNLYSKINRIIPNDFFLGFCLKDTLTGEQVCINEEESFPLASIAKFISSVGALETNNNIPEDLIRKAISNHSNESFYKMLDIVDIDTINENLCKKDINIQIDRDNTSWENNYASPISMLKFLDYLYKEKLIKEKKT